MPRPNNKHEENTPTKTLNASLGQKTRGKIKCLDTDSPLLTPPPTPTRTPTKGQRSDRTSPIPLLPPPKNRKSSVSPVVANPTNNNCRKSITFTEPETYPTPARVPTSLINSLKQLGTDLGNLISPPNTPSTIPSLQLAHTQGETNLLDKTETTDLIQEVVSVNNGPDKTNEEVLIQTENTQEAVPDDVEVIAVIPRILKKATTVEETDITKCHQKTNFEANPEDSQKQEDTELGKSVSSDLYIIQKVKLLRKTSTEYNSFSLDNESVRKTIQNKENDERQLVQKELDFDTSFCESSPKENYVHKDQDINQSLYNGSALNQSSKKDQHLYPSLPSDKSEKLSLDIDQSINPKKDTISDETLDNDEALIKCVQKDLELNQSVQESADVNQYLQKSTLQRPPSQNGHECEKVSQNLNYEPSKENSLQSNQSKTSSKSLRKKKTFNQSVNKTTKQVVYKEKDVKKPSSKEKPLSQLSDKGNIVRKSQRKTKLVSDPLNESILESPVLHGDLKVNKDCKEKTCKQIVDKVATVPKDEIEIDSTSTDCSDNRVLKRKAVKGSHKELTVTLKDEVELNPRVRKCKSVRSSKRKTSKERSSNLNYTQIEEIQFGPPIKETRVQKRKIRNCRPGDLTGCLSDEIEFDPPVKKCKDTKVSKNKVPKYRLGELTGDEIECDPSELQKEEIRAPKRKSCKIRPGEYAEDKVEADPKLENLKGRRHSKRKTHKCRPSGEKIELDPTGEHCKDSRFSKRKTQKCRTGEFSGIGSELEPIYKDKIKFDSTDDCKLNRDSKKITKKETTGGLTGDESELDPSDKDCKGSRVSRRKTRGCNVSELAVVSNDELEFHAGGEIIRESRALSKKRTNGNLYLANDKIDVRPSESVGQSSKRSKKSLSLKQLQQPLDELSGSFSLESKSTDTISKICDDLSLSITENSVPCLSGKRSRGRPPAKKLDLVSESETQSPQIFSIPLTGITTRSPSRKPRDNIKPKHSKSNSIVRAAPVLIPNTSKLKQKRCTTQNQDQSSSTDSKKSSPVLSLPTKLRYNKTAKLSSKSKNIKPLFPEIQRKFSKTIQNLSSEDPHSSTTSQEPHRPSRNIQQPARYLDSLDTATKDSIAVMRLHQMKRGKSLTYDLNNLSWNNDHTVNEQGVYCYCGDSGSWYSKMVECSRCQQWFHERCLAPRPMAMPIIFGDLFYLFVCSSCNHGSECLKRMDMSWTDLVHLALFDLTVKTSRRFHDLEKDLVPEILSNWSLFQMPKPKNALSETEKKEMIHGVLIENKDRFTNGLDADQSETLWGLGLLSPPPRPKYKVPELGIISERTVLSEVVVDQPRYNPNAENVMPIQDMIVKYDQYVFPSPKLKKARKRPSSKINDSVLLEKNQADLENTMSKKRLKLDSSHHSISINPGKEANAFQIQVNFLKKKHKTSGKSTFRLEKINLKVQKLKKPRDEKINNDQDCFIDPNAANNSLENISLKVQKIKKPRQRKLRKDEGNEKDLTTLNNISLSLQKIKKTRENGIRKKKSAGKKSATIIGGLNDISLKYKRLREKKIKNEDTNSGVPPIKNDDLEKVNLKVRKFRKPREKKINKDLQNMEAPSLRNGDQEKLPQLKKLRDKKVNKDKGAMHGDSSSNNSQVPATSNGVTTRSLTNANPQPKTTKDVRIELNKRLHKELGIRVAMKFAEVTPKPREEVEALLQAQLAGPKNKRKNYKEYKNSPMLLPDTYTSSSFMDTLIPPPQNYNESNNPFKNNLRRLTEKDLTKKRKKKDKTMMEESRQLSSSFQSVTGNKEGSNSPQILNGINEGSNSSQSSNGNNDSTSSTNGNKRSMRIRCTRSSQFLNPSNEGTSTGPSQSFFVNNNGRASSKSESGNNKDEFSFKIPYGTSEEPSSSQLVNRSIEQIVLEAIEHIVDKICSQPLKGGNERMIIGNDENPHGDENFTRDRLKARVLSSEGKLLYLMK